MQTNRKKAVWWYLGKGLLISLGISLSLAAINYGVSMYYVYHHSQARMLKHADAALVLGAAAWDKQPSPVFRERINHAIALYRQGMVDKLIFTGGTPKAGFMTEAAVGRRYAIKHGVDKEDIVYENQSRDTWQNLINARSIASNNNIDSLIIVSDPYHLARAMVMARDLGMKVQISPTPTSRYNTTNAKLRFLAQESYLLLLYYWSHLFTQGIHYLQARFN